MSLRLRPGVSTARTEDGMVLLDEHTGGYLQLNRTGAYVLDGIAAGRDPGSIAARLAEHYGLDGDRADADVRAVVTQLRNRKIVEES